MIACPEPSSWKDAEEFCWLLSRVFFPNDIQPPTGWWAMPDGDMSEAYAAWHGGYFQAFVKNIWDAETCDITKTEVVTAYTKYKLTGNPIPVDDLQVDYSRI